MVLEIIGRNICMTTQQVFHHIQVRIDCEDRRIDSPQKPSRSRSSFPTVSMLTSGSKHNHTYATSPNAIQSYIIGNEADRKLVKTHTFVGIIMSLTGV